MSHFLRSSLTAEQPVIVKGEAGYLIYETVKRYLDACGGDVVSSLDHDSKAVRTGAASQMESMTYAHTPACSPINTPKNSPAT
jgi:adenosylmethionine-8-amino-7-oxononanoate aminotransferase